MSRRAWICFGLILTTAASLGPHANVVSGNSSNAQITGASDQAPVIVTAS